MGDLSKPFSFGALVFLSVKWGHGRDGLTYPFQMETLGGKAASPGSADIDQGVWLLLGCKTLQSTPAWGGGVCYSRFRACSNGHPLAQRTCGEQPHLGHPRSAPEFGRLDSSQAPPALLKVLLGELQPLFWVLGSDSLGRWWRPQQVAPCMHRAQPRPQWQKAEDDGLCPLRPA